MTGQNTFSARTRANWLIDFAVFAGGLLAALTGVYFLYLPSGGYRGGLNPARPARRGARRGRDRLEGLTRRRRGRAQ